jgi:hypothetical protein
MGFSPEEIGAMSLWQFNTCQDGWIKAQGGAPELPPPTDEQHEYLVAKHAGKSAKPTKRKGRAHGP